MRERVTRTLTPEQRADLLEELGAAMRNPRSCPILQLLHVASGAAGIGATQDEIDELYRRMSCERLEAIVENAGPHAPVAAAELARRIEEP